MPFYNKQFSSQCVSPLTDPFEKTFLIFSYFGLLFFHKQKWGTEQKWPIGLSFLDSQPANAVDLIKSSHNELSWLSQKEKKVDNYYLVPLPHLLHMRDVQNIKKSETSLRDIIIDTTLCEFYCSTDELNQCTAIKSITQTKSFKGTY